MHRSAYVHAVSCVQEYAPTSRCLGIGRPGIRASENRRVAHRDLCDHDVEYPRVDGLEGGCADAVTAGPCRPPVNPESADLGIAGQTVEHFPSCRALLPDDAGVLDPGGIEFVAPLSRVKCSSHPDGFRASNSLSCRQLRYRRADFLPVKRNRCDPARIGGKDACWGDSVGVGTRRHPLLLLFSAPEVTVRWANRVGGVADACSRRRA